MGVDVTTWTLHWLDATGDLTAWKERISGQIDEAFAKMAPFVRPDKMDILIERGNETVWPETGMKVRVTRPNLATLIFDPYNDNFTATLMSGLVQRQMVNTAHQAMRAAGPGYGFTLGGAMVSEGLAAQFVRLVFDAPLEPWGCAFSSEELAVLWPDQRVLMSPKFDHGEWFSGTGSKPKWLGYSLGARIVENWLISGAELTPDRLINVPAPKVLNVGAVQALVS